MNRTESPVEPPVVPPSMEKNAFLSMDNNRRIEKLSDPDSVVAVESAKSTSRSVKKSLSAVVAGGFAGILAKTAVAPLERIKIMFQVTNEKFSLTKFPGIIRNIQQTEGILALWKGHSAAILRVFPYSGIQFAAFDFMKSTVSSSSSSSDHLSLQMTMACGGVAAGVSTAMTYPLDLARARLAIMPKGVDSKPFRMFRYMKKWYLFGGVQEIFRGIIPTLVGVIPYGAIAFTVNETGKTFLTRDTKTEPTTLQKLFCGAFAGLVAQSVTYPFEVVRRRMQTEGIISREVGSISALHSSNVQSFTNRSASLGSSAFFKEELTMVNCARDIVSKQGIMGLFKGLSLNYIKGPIAISISFVSYDILKKVFVL